MDVSCPSLPPKILVADTVRPNAQTTAFMAAHGCHLPTGCLFVLLVILESFFLSVRDTMIARAVLYKVSIAIVSRSFLTKAVAAASILLLVVSCLTCNERGDRMAH